MASFSFELVSPTRLVFSGEVEQVDVPGAEGDFGVLANHAPFITPLRPGVLTVRNGSETKKLFVKNGFAEVNQKGLTVLAETAVPVEEIERDAFATAIKEAEQAVTEAKDEAERWQAVAALEQLKAAAAQVGAGSVAAH